MSDDNVFTIQEGNKTLAVGKEFISVEENLCCSLFENDRLVSTKDVIALERKKDCCGKNTILVATAAGWLDLSNQGKITLSTDQYKQLKDVIVNSRAPGRQTM